MYHKSLFTSFMKSKTVQSVNKQLITNSSKTLNKNSKTPSNSKFTAKVTVVRRRIPSSKDTITAVEWKNAASVIKRLNWENKCLYGPVQSSKPSTYDINKIEESNQIIQHETQIPIIELPVEQNISVMSNKELQTNLEKSLNFRDLLTFPLLNKAVSSNSNFKNKIEDWNTLRKNLEILSRNSSVPSVSLILEKTMPKERIEVLEQWKQNMIRQLGEEGFQRYQRDLFANGQSLHNSINSYLASTPESEILIKEENMGHWKSLKQIFPHVKEVKLLEEFVRHPFLCYRGIVDCFAIYKNELVVIDWKTSKKPKLNIKSTYDNPLQIAAYVGALNFDPKYQYLASKGLIVVAYESGSPASVHFINESTMFQYWKEWLQRVKQFWEWKSLEMKNS